LGRIGRKLSSWRERRGGRGRPIPEQLWAEAVEVAAVAGVNEAARALGVDRERLARRVAERSSRASSEVALPTHRAHASAAFVEVDAHRVFARGVTVVRLTSRDGEQLEIEGEGGAVDVAAVARVFWERAR
jgi:hypothetical protein